MARTETCDCCKKRRKCERVGYSHYCVSECLSLSTEERKAKSFKVRTELALNPKPRIAYPIIGGPLDGSYAATVDFQRGYNSPSRPEWSRPEGMYAHLSNEYISFNRSGGSRVKIGAFPPSMVYIHKSILQPLASPKDR